jgi:HAMP domain-containing protein/putative methionine-R-sulfoxide reductase with GAF domain
MNSNQQNKSAFSTLSVVILCILVTILTSLFYYLINNQVTANNKSMTITSKLTAQSVMEKVDRNFYERFGDVQAFAFNQLAVATASRDSVVDGTQEFINTMTAYYVLYDLMVICNRDGKILAVNTKDKNGNKINSAHFVNATVSQEEWFKVCTSPEGPKGGAWFSDFMAQGEIGRIYGTAGYGMGFAAPIKNTEGTVIGVWYNYASWKEVTDGIRDEAEENLRKDHKGAFVILTNHEGQIISARDSTLVLAHALTANNDDLVQSSNHAAIPVSDLTYGVSRSKGAYTFAGKGWVTAAFIPREKISWSLFFTRQNILAVVVCLVILSAAAGYVYSYFNKQIINRINEIRRLQQQLSQGEIIQVGEDNHQRDEFGEMKRSLSVLAESLRAKAAFSDEISKRNLSVKLENVSTGDVLGQSLINMQSQLKLALQADTERNWVAEGLAQISVVLRSFDSTDVLYAKIIKFVVSYLKANQAGLFLIKEHEGQHNLTLVSCYAYDKKKYVEKTLSLDQGLIGQCMAEKGTLYLTDIPEDYMHITSGLGGATAKSLLIIPLQSNEEIYGAIEIGSFNKFMKHEIVLAEKMAESIAASIGAIEKSEQTKILLEQLQQQTEEMKAQEEEMRQNMEELSATQEDMLRKEKQYKVRIESLEK